MEHRPPGVHAATADRCAQTPLPVEAPRATLADPEDLRPEAAIDRRARIATPDRMRLRQLDECLTQLEEVHEQDGTIVTADLVVRLGATVPLLRPGMLVTEALDLVFTAQEAYLPIGRAAALAGRDAGSLSRPDDACALAPTEPRKRSTLPLVASMTAWTEPLDEARARELTERIRSTTRRVCILLFEAHERRAWPLLSYSTWAQYVHCEFGFSRSRSYELVDQGRVIQAVRAVAGMSGIPDISAYAALQVKSHLSSLLPTVAERTAAVPQSEMGRVVARVVRELRSRLACERLALATDRNCVASEGVVRPLLTSSVGGVPAGSAQDQLLSLFAAIDSLAHMPPVGETMAAVTRQELDRLAHLDGALEWLVEFAGVWKANARPLTSQAI
jgi:hypothetical protein